MMVLPPGVNAPDFADTLRMFEAVVGKDWVFSRDEDLMAYRDYFSPIWGDPDEPIPGAAVCCSTVEEVQGIVRAANKHKVPLFPISTGKNFAYGGPAPNLRGTVVVDLKRMNRILAVDEGRNFALLEPGVTYLELYHYIQERGLKVWMDCADPGWGGPVGNSLDHGIGYTMAHFRDHFGSHVGMEVVLANGEVMRTGMGALPNADSWQDYPYGYGPSPNGLFGQGNFGIVTKMGFRLMPQPEHYRSGMIMVPKRQDFIPLVKLVNYLSDSSLMGMATYHSPLAALMQNQEFRNTATKRGGPSDAEMDKFASDNHLASWQVLIEMYGPEPTTLANWEYAKERAARDIPGASFIDVESYKVPLTPEQVNAVNPYHDFHREASQAIASLGIWDEMSRTTRNPGGGKPPNLAFIPIIPRSGEAVFKFQRVIGDALHDLGVPGFMSAISTPFYWHSFAFQMGAGVPQLGNDKAAVQEAHRKLFRLIEIAGQHGWGDYRATPFLQDTAAGVYSFNDHALRRFHEGLKDAVDPNGILAPGRGGIWPRQLRNLRGHFQRKFG